MPRLAVLSGSIRIELIMKGCWRQRGWRTLGAVPQLQVAQDLFDDRAGADQADNFEWFGAVGTDQGICLIHFLDQPGPRTPALVRQLGAAVRTLLLLRLSCGRRSGCRCCHGRGNPARMGKSSVIPDELLSRIRDMGAQSGREVERGKDSGRGGLGIGAAAPLSAVVDDLPGFGTTAQTLQRDRWMNHAACCTASGRVIVGSNRLALEN